MSDFVTKQIDILDRQYPTDFMTQDVFAVLNTLLHDEERGDSIWNLICYCYSFGRLNGIREERRRRAGR